MVKTFLATKIPQRSSRHHTFIKQFRIRSKILRVPLDEILRYWRVEITM